MVHQSLLKLYHAGSDAGFWEGLLEPLPRQLDDVEGS